MLGYLVSSDIPLSKACVLPRQGGGGIYFNRCIAPEIGMKHIEDSTNDKHGSSKGLASSDE